MGEYNKTAKPQNISEYEAICFDEILLYGPHYLRKIYDFMTMTDKKYMQLEMLTKFNHSVFI